MLNRIQWAPQDCLGQASSRTERRKYEDAGQLAGVLGEGQ
jgi:hypothetical protein